MKELSGKYVKVLLIALACFTLLTAVSSLPQSASAASTNLYASPTGSGTTCSLAAPCSLTGAQTKVRTLNTGTMTGDIVVYLRAGTYTLASTFQLTNADSGNSGFKVIYQNYTGETPVISGGTQVTGWTLHDSGLNIWKASVSSSLRFRQLYVNGTRTIRARIPNMTDANTRGPYYAATTGMSGSAPYTFGVNASELANWANLTQVEVVMVNHWKLTKARISSFTGGTISFLSPENSDPVMPHILQSGTPHYYENAYEFIDAEGEFYLNTTTNILYYKPRMGETMSSATVIAPNLDNLVTVTGADNTTNMAHDIRITGITFQYSNMTLPNSIGYVNYQAGAKYGSSLWPLGTYYPGAIQLRNSRNITFDYNTISQTGAQGILALDDTKDSIFDHNTITDTSSGGIYLGLRSSNSSGNRVTYNKISYGGMEYTDTVGIFLDFAPYTVVNHNEVAYYRYTGISSGLDWSDVDTTATNIEIGYNSIHNVMLLHDDGAGIYTLGKIPNMNIHDNYVYSLSASGFNGGYPFAGIYPDNGSTGKTVQNNVIDSVPSTFYAYNPPNYGNTFQNNYYNSTFGNIGTNTNINNTFVAGAWPAAALTIINNAGTQSAPTTPAGLNATAGNAQISLSWMASAGATSYNIKRSTTSGGSYTTIYTGVTTTSKTDTGLTNGTPYYYVVSAVNSYGESGNSSQASAAPSASLSNNLALNRTATAYYMDGSTATMHPGGGAANAVDGNISTVAQATNQYRWQEQVDLGSVQSIGRIVVIMSASAYATAFNITTSTDGTNFTTVKQITGFTSGTSDNPITATNARYVRVVAVTPDGYGQTGGQMSISELEVYASGSGSDTTAPAAVSNLAVGTTTSNATPLSWTSPGDDGSTGTATSYDIRYSTSTITTANWASATQATGEPTPVAAGTNQSFTVTGLSANTTYYFAMKTSDEVPNVSGLSNVPSGMTATGMANLALNRTATAYYMDGSTATMHPGGGAANAVDGNISTVAQATNQYRWQEQVDLGSVQSIGRIVVIMSASAYATAFNITTSTDGTNFTTVKQITGFTSGTSDNPITATNARYVRVVAVTPDGYGQTGGQMSISELEVYASGSSSSDRLQLSVTNDGTAVSNRYTYNKFSNKSYTFQTGDYIEYDVNLANNIFGSGGIDITNTDGSYFRGITGWVDQNTVSGHPGANISIYAYNGWFHRKMTVPGSMVGKTAAEWAIAGENDTTSLSYSALYDNIKVTDGNVTVKSTIFANAADYTASGTWYLAGASGSITTPNLP